VAIDIGDFDGEPSVAEISNQTRLETFSVLVAESMMYYFKITTTQQQHQSTTKDNQTTT
jgi:hypothetical protein